MTVDAFFFMVAGAMLDPIALVALALPGLLHNRWWPRLIWAGAWAALAAILIGRSTYGLAIPASSFCGALIYMSLLWALRQLLLKRQPLRQSPRRPIA